MGDIRTRLDETTAKLRKLDPLERRVSSIEKRLGALEGPKKASASRKPAAKKSAARKSATRAKPEPPPSPESN